jgi:hypothetical protein
VVQPLRVRQHRHPRLALHALHQPGAAARNDQVDQPGGAEHGLHEAAIGVRRDLHRRLRQAGGGKAAGDRRMDRAGGMKTLRTAAQQDGVAGFDREPSGIGADIRAAFIDHAEHPDRLGDAADAQPVRACPFRQHAMQRVGQGGDIAQAFGHRLDPRLGQTQPIGKRRARGAGGKIARIGGKDRRGSIEQRSCGGF